MTAQELKNSILQLAVQGKLVEQRPEEGTAKELLAGIKAEKEQLIKDKKIKKEKPLPEITDEEKPFDIPESWEWVRLGNVLDIARGASPRPIKEYITSDENGVNWIKIGDSDKGGKYINSTSEKITLEGKEKSRFVEKGSFLLSNSMSFGRPYILNIDGCIHDGWLVLSQRVNVFEQDYLYYLLSSSMVYYQFCNKVSGAVVNNLNSDKVRETIVPLPPLEEQKRIVARIEEILPYIDQYDKAYTKLEEFNKKFPEDMKKSVLQLAMQGKLVEQRPEEGTAEELYQQIVEEKAKLIKEGKIKKEKPLADIAEQEIPFEIPASWKWVRLGNIAWYLDAGKSPNCEKKPVVDNEWGVITTTAIQEGYFDERQNKILPENYVISDTMKVCVDDILITRAGPMNRTGIVCKVSELSCNLILSDKTVRINLTKNYICRDFVVAMINSPQIRRSVIDLMSGMDKQQVNISQEKIKSIMIPLPPLVEQKRIVARIEEILPYCEQLVK